MDVDDFFRESPEEGFFDDAHESGKDNVIDFGIEECVGECLFDFGFELSFEFAWRAGVGGESTFAGFVEDGCIGEVAGYEGYLDR